jgi:hypothetical protein
MNGLANRYDVTKKDLAKGRNLRIAAWTAPFLLTGIPAAVFLFLLFVFGSTPPTAATILFLGLIVTFIGFVLGIGIAGFLTYRRSAWTKQMRERIAADGIKANEVDWFRNELKPSERRALKEMENRDALLADAYRETLASRLTATRIIRSSRRELQMAQRRQNKLKLLKSEKKSTFLDQIKTDIAKISEINDEARQMLGEAESRLQMIEAAASRGGSMVDSQLALERLTARTAELPLALEAVRIEEEIRRELQSGDIEKEKLLPEEKL